jgi:small subunit ribosomal protein S16
MLVIRLTRVGKTKQPSYRIVVQEKSKDPWGGAVERLGHYNPLTNPATLTVNEERVRYWVSKGAQPSDTLWNLLLERGLVTGEKRRIVQLSKKRKEKAAAAPAAATA